MAVEQLLRHGGHRPLTGLAQVAAVLSSFDAEPDAARTAYRRLVADGVGAESPWKSLRGQIWLGSEAFRARMARLVPKDHLAAVPAAQVHPDRPIAEEVIAAVAEACTLEVSSGGVSA